MVENDAETLNSGTFYYRHKKNGMGNYQNHWMKLSIVSI